MQLDSRLSNICLILGIERNLMGVHIQREAQMKLFFANLDKKKEVESVKHEAIIVAKFKHKEKPKAFKIEKSTVNKNDSFKKISAPNKTVSFNKLNLEQSCVKIMKPSKNDKKLLSSMAEREKHRLKRKEQLKLQREEKKKLEEEKKLLEAKEKEIAENVERERIAQQKSELEKEAKLKLQEKIEQRERLRQLLKVAEAFHQKSTVKYYGIFPLCRFIERQKQKFKIADDYRNTALVEIVFKDMSQILAAKQNRQHALASFFQSSSLTRFYLKAWKDVANF